MRLNITCIRRSIDFLNAREVIHVYTCTCHDVSFLSALGIWPDWQRCHVMVPMLQNKTSLPVCHCSPLNFLSAGTRQLAWLRSDRQIIQIFWHELVSGQEDNTSIFKASD